MRAFAGIALLSLLPACQRPAPAGAGGSAGGVTGTDGAIRDGAGAPPDAAGKASAGGARDAGTKLWRVVAAGDIACDGCAQSATAALIDQLVTTDGVSAVLALGDLAYTSGSAAEFKAYYDPAWGRASIRRLTHPVPGNHEYASGSAKDYFDYFNGAGSSAGPAGPSGDGYYSFDLGAWHVVALNSSDACRFVSCGQSSAQHDWLVADLAAHPSLCTLAFWHHPRFQAGSTSGELAAAAPLWEALVDAGADVVLNGHEHGYQQLSPLDKSGQLDPAQGIRTFVVGTGGGDFDTTFGGPRLPALEASVITTHGVLELTLSDSGYDWQFIGVDGSRPLATSGSGVCH